jgi:dTDP-4-dehydrorhamnose reductase
VGGSTCLSKHEFGRRLATEFDLDPELIVRASLVSAGLRAPRGRNLCLRGARAERELGLPLPTIAQGIAAFRRLRDLGTVDRLHSMLPDRAQSPWSAAQEEIPL